MPQGHPFPTKCWLATGSSQTIPQKTTQLPQDQNTHNSFTPHQVLTSFPVWAEQHHLHTTTIHTFVAYPQSTQSHWCSLPPYPHLWPPDTPPEAPGWGQRSHRTGYTPTYCRGTWHHSCISIVDHGPTMPRPTGSNKTCINAHTHTAHGPWDTPTSLIRLICRVKICKECFGLALMWAITCLFFSGHFRSLITLAWSSLALPDPSHFWQKKHSYGQAPSRLANSIRDLPPTHFNGMVPFGLRRKRFVREIWRSIACHDRRLSCFSTKNTPIVFDTTTNGTVYESLVEVTVLSSRLVRFMLSHDLDISACRPAGLKMWHARGAISDSCMHCTFLWLLCSSLLWLHELPASS